MKTSYLFKAFSQGLAVCFVVSAISFFLLFLNSDPALMLLPPESEPADIEIFKESMGLNRPLMIQYADYLQRLVFRGDFGQSFVARRPVLQIIAEKLPATVSLSLGALIFANVLAVIFGVISAARHHSLFDNIVNFFTLVGQALPSFWFGIVLIVCFGVWLKWLPVSGMGGIKHYILPVVTLGAGMLPINLRLVRTNMLEVLDQDYIRTARAKGLKERRVLFLHAFKNACIPLVTVTGLQVGMLLSGATIIENVFAWPGIGHLAISSIHMGDYPVVQAVVVLSCVAAVIGNLLGDLCAMIIDSSVRSL